MKIEPEDNEIAIDHVTKEAISTDVKAPAPVDNHVPADKVVLAGVPGISSQILCPDLIDYLPAELPGPESSRHPI